MAADNGGERLTRIEHELDELRTDVRILLRAQVLQKDELDNHESRLDRIEAAIDRMTAHGREVDDRIDKLVSAIGALVQRSTPGSS